MIDDRSIRSQCMYESRFNCIICLERVKSPISCIRCKNLICQNHLRKIDNRCPYCRLSPYQYEQDKFTQKMVDWDKKKEEQFLISHKIFRCLVQGCDFEGKYHKMDLHRRRQHRQEELRQILFPQEREKGKKRRAMEMLMKKMEEKEQKSNKSYHIAVILFSKINKKVDVKHLYAMALHSENCGHINCERVFAEDTMCFIGNSKKELSDCPEALKFLTFYE